MQIDRAVFEKSRAQNRVHKIGKKKIEKKKPQNNKKVFRWKRKTLTRRGLVANNE